MKIWCDVCDKEEASVFCSADEAALCHGCDRHVHFANKLASKHSRFSLATSTFKESPLCDICQERRALLFCHEDRAILCRECDIPIHQANEHTQKHNRFLLTGVKLSAVSSSYSTTSEADQVKTRHEIFNSHPIKITSSSVSGEIFSSPSTRQSTSNHYYGFDDGTNTNHQVSDSGSVSTSSISEYVMEKLPGWRVEDLLDHPSSVSNDGFFRFCGSSPYDGIIWEEKPFS